MKFRLRELLTFIIIGFLGVIIWNIFQLSTHLFQALLVFSFGIMGAFIGIKVRNSKNK